MTATSTAQTVAPAAVAEAVTAASTVDAIVAASKRGNTFPLRREFLQRRVDGRLVPGPLAHLVRAGDGRGLKLYLLLVTKASSAPWDAKLPAPVWARALGIELPTTASARSAISKTWLRLEDLQLIGREREDRKAKVTLRHESGSGGEYASPDKGYFQVPLALWLAGPNPDQRWYQLLTVPELAVLLIGRSLGDEFRLPAENGPEWYGISADTINRGVKGLKDHELLAVDIRKKTAPLSSLGYTFDHHYSLTGAFKVGRVSGKPAAKAKATATAIKKKVRRVTAPPRKVSPSP